MAGWEPRGAGRAACLGRGCRWPPVAAGAQLLVVLANRVRKRVLVGDVTDGEEKQRAGHGARKRMSLCEGEDWLLLGRAGVLKHCALRTAVAFG